jgi:hypothetical protein
MCSPMSLRSYYYRCSDYMSVLPCNACDCIVGCISKMVCMAGHFKMSSVLKLVMMENHTAPGEV